MTNLRTSCDVAVIGAGAAGIAVTRALHAAGYATQLIEARGRAGGRAFTAICDGFPIDFGCGWLHSADDNPYVGLAREYGFTVDETTPPWQKLNYEEAFDPSEQKAFRAAQAKFYARLEKAARAARDVPAATLLEPGAPWNALIDAVSTYVNGCELSKLSVKDFDNYHDSELNYRIVEGYGALVARLGAEIPITFDCPATRIDHSGVDIIVETEKGALRARAVVMCAPTNILARQQIEFFPALPEKVDAAAHLPLGVADKVYLTVERPEDLPLNSRLFGRLDRTDTGAYHLLPFGRPLIEGYFGGACARELEKGGLPAFADFAIGEICGMLGSAWRNRLKPLTSSAWALDPYALGSYSHALPGCWDRRATLAAPHEDRLFFAGEATAPHYFSTAHGAHETGLRAAREVMQALGAPA